MISRVFKPYMSLYLKLERAHLVELVRSLLAEEKWGQDTEGDGDEDEEEDDENPVLHSVGKIFVYIKRSLTQCEAVDTGETLLHLSKVFQDTLVMFGEGVHKHILELCQNRSGGAKMMSLAEERTVAVIINTCEYTTETAEQLQISVVKVIDPALAPQVCVFDGISDCFDAAMDSAVSALVNSVLVRLDTALAPIAKMKWAETDSVGDQSQYVNACQAVLEEAIPPIRDTLSATFFSALCDKWAAGFYPRLQGIILRVKRVSDDAVQQLLLDVHALKTIILALPAVGQSKDKGKAGASFSKLVTAESSKVESLLKVLLSPPEQVEHNYAALLKGEVKPPLQRLLEMKGLAQPKQGFDVVEAGQAFTDSMGAAGQALTGTTVSMAGRLNQASIRKGVDSMGSMAGMAVGTMSSTVGMFGSTVKNVSSTVDSGFKTFTTKE